VDAVKPPGFRAGYYVHDYYLPPHKVQQAIARAEWLARNQRQVVPVLHVQQHGGMARVFHHATGVRHT
jgi:hypothetical protein